jgi:hypothetical protein
LEWSDQTINASEQPGGASGSVSRRTKLIPRTAPTVTLHNLSTANGEVRSQADVADRASSSAAGITD